MSDEQQDDVPAGVDEIVETLLDGGAAYFSDEEGNSMDDVLAMAETFGVDPSDVDAWVAAGADIGEVEALAAELAHHLKAERIPAVVRRPASRLDGRSLIHLLAKGRSAEALAATVAMFNFGHLT